MVKRHLPSNRRLAVRVLAIFGWISLAHGLLMAGIWGYFHWAVEGKAGTELEVALERFYALTRTGMWVSVISIGVIVGLALLLIFAWSVRREKADEPKQED